MKTIPRIDHQPLTFFMCSHLVRTSTSLELQHALMFQFIFLGPPLSFLLSQYVLLFATCSGRAARNGALSARRATRTENPVPVAHPAQRGAASDVQHTLLGEGKCFTPPLSRLRAVTNESVFLFFFAGNTLEIMSEKIDFFFFYNRV